MYEGHFEEVTGLAIVKKHRMVVSVSIDATVRRWSLEDGELERAVRETEEKKKKNGGGAGGALAEGEGEGGGEMKARGMTEEEEKELEDLMNDE